MQDALAKGLKALHGGSLFEMPLGKKTVHAVRGFTSSLDDDNAEDADDGAQRTGEESRYMHCRFNVRSSYE